MEVVTVTQDAPPATVGRQARFQPLLLVLACLVVLPALATGRAPDWATVLIGTCMVGAFVVWSVDKVRPFGTRSRDRAALGLTVASLVGLSTVMLTDGAVRPGAYLMAVAAYVAALASAPTRALRVGFQGAAVAVTGVAFVLADRSPVSVSVVVLLLVLLASLVDALAGELRAARRLELAARRDAERRADLLSAVRSLPGRSTAGATEAVVGALRQLGYDAATVRLLGRDGDLHDVHLDTIESDGGSLVPGPDLVWQALSQDTTVARADDDSESSPQHERVAARSAVATPIRVQRRPVGALVGARREPQVPSAAEIEIVEVLASHLGVAMEADRQVERQRELLDRMEQLDRLRSEFVGSVSGEIRDPITVLRGISQILGAHGEELPSAQRAGLLANLQEQADELRQALDTTLDLARLKARRGDPSIRAVALRALLRAQLDAGSVTFESAPDAAPSPEDVFVRADDELLRAALVLLGAMDTGAGGSSRLRVDVGTRSATEVAVVVERRGSSLSDLVTSVATQLVVAGGGRLDTSDLPTILLEVASITPVSGDGDVADTS